MAVGLAAASAVVVAPSFAGPGPSPLCVVLPVSSRLSPACMHARAPRRRGVLACRLDAGSLGGIVAPPPMLASFVSNFFGSIPAGIGASVVGRDWLRFGASVSGRLFSIRSPSMRSPLSRGCAASSGPLGALVRAIRVGVLYRPACRYPRRP